MWVNSDQTRILKHGPRGYFYQPNVDKEILDNLNKRDFFVETEECKIQKMNIFAGLDFFMIFTTREKKNEAIYCALIKLLIRVDYVK